METKDVLSPLDCKLLWGMSLYYKENNTPLLINKKEFKTTDLQLLGFLKLLKYNDYEIVSVSIFDIKIKDGAQEQTIPIRHLREL